jgi:hypothetical protein
VVNSNVFDATVAICFPENTLNAANKSHLSLFLNIYEQQRKVEAKRLKESKSRATIHAVNNRSVEQLAADNEDAVNAEAGDAAQRFASAIERVANVAQRQVAGWLSGQGPPVSQQFSTERQ